MMIIKNTSKKLNIDLFQKFGSKNKNEVADFEYFKIRNYFVKIYFSIAKKYMFVFNVN
jgi:hypothetical protein